MFGTAIQAFCKLGGKRKKILAGLLRMAMHGAAQAVPGVGWAIKFVGELAGAGTTRLSDPTSGVPGVKDPGESFGNEELGQINDWMANITEKLKGVTDRVEKLIEVNENEALDKVFDKVKDLLFEREDLAKQFDTCLKEVRQQTLSLQRIEQMLDEHFHVQKRIAAGMEDIKALLADAPFFSDWCAFRKARPDALQAIVEADEHFLAGRREEGMRILVGLMRQRGAGQATLARHVGLLSAADGKLDDARSHFSVAGKSSPSISITRALSQLSTFATNRGRSSVWRSLPRGFIVDRRFRIEEEVGRGGMGSVYRATGVDRVNKGKVFALKVPAPGLMSNEETAQRFVQEIEISQRLSEGRHANIVATIGYALFEDPHVKKELYALVMEFIDGGSLAHYLMERSAKNKPLSPSEIVQYLQPVCEALSFAHRHRPAVLHRDVKPHNVMIARDGTVKLMDFGIARVLDSAQEHLTRAGQAVGTPAYMPPELLTPGSPIDERTDVYLAGNLLLELMTFSPSGNAEMRTDCSSEWMDLIADSMNRIRSKRPATIAQFLDRLIPLAPIEAEEAPIKVEVVPPTPRAPALRSNLVVASDGSGDFSTINEALQYSTDDAAIRVRPGFYRETVRLSGRRSLTGEGTRDRIVIEYAHSACLTLDGEVTVRGLTLRGLRGMGSTPSTAPAVTISRGKNLLEDCAISCESASGVLVFGNAESKIRDCTIHDCLWEPINVAGASAKILRCDLARTERHGLYVGKDGDAFVQDGRIHDCQGAGAMMHEGGKAEITGCEIDHNQRCNVEVSHRGQATLRRCNIHASKSTGVWLHDHGRADVIECELSANQLSGVELDGQCEATVRQSKFRHNQCGVLVDNGGKATIVDCDIAENKLHGVELRNNGTATIRKTRFRNHPGLDVKEHLNGRAILDNCDLEKKTTAAPPTVTEQKKGNPAVDMIVLLVIGGLILIGVAWNKSWFGLNKKAVSNPPTQSQGNNQLTPQSEQKQNEDFDKQVNHELREFLKKEVENAFPKEMKKSEFEKERGAFPTPPLGIDHGGFPEEKGGRVVVIDD